MTKKCSIVFTINYNEYFNYFWSWGKKKIASILTLPDQKMRYIKGKFIFALLLCMPVFVSHIIHFSFLNSLLSSVLIIVTVPYISTLKSLKMEDSSNLLYTGSFTKIRTTLSYGITLIVASLINWYGILNQENDALKYLVVSVVLIIPFYSRKYAYNYWENYEWSS